MNNKDLALTYAEKISRAIEQQQYEQAIEEIQDLRPIDIADLLALIEPKLAWQLLAHLPNRSTIFAYLDPDSQVALAYVFPRAILAKIVGERLEMMLHRELLDVTEARKMAVYPLMKKARLVP